MEYKAAPQLDELAAISSALEFLRIELGCEVQAYSEEDAGKYDPANKAAKSMPLRPGLYME